MATLPNFPEINVSRLRLPDIDLQGLIDKWSETAFGATYETGTDPYGNTTYREEPGMFDYARQIAGDEVARKKRAFDLYERSKQMDLKAAQQAMELRRLQDQRARQAELQARADAERARLEQRGRDDQTRMDLFGSRPAPGTSFVPTGTMPGFMRYGGTGMGGGVTVGDLSPWL